MDFKTDDVIKLLAKTLTLKVEDIKKEFEDLENITKEDFEETIQGIADDRFKHVQKRSKERALKQAKRTERASAEKEISEALGIDKMTLTDQIDHIKTLMEGSGDKQNGNELTTESLKINPLVIDYVKALKLDSAEKEAEILKIRGERKQDNIKSKVKALALDKLNELNANFGDTEDSRKDLLSKFERLLHLDNKFDLDDNGKIIVVDDEGKQKHSNSKMDDFTPTHAVEGAWMWGYKGKEDEGKRGSNPKENNFNKTKFDHSEETLKDAGAIYEKINEATKAGRKEEATFLTEALSKLSNG